MTTSDILTWSGGSCPRPREPREITGVSIDTRTALPGNVYIAIKGEKFDGHDFIPQAIEKGVRGIVVSRTVHVPDGIHLVNVENTTNALKKIANGYRRSISAKIIAIAGSNGKTSTKNMLATILGDKNKITKTQANNNNKIGVSMTLLSATIDDRYVVVEVGTNAPGEIEELCQIIAPDHAILTNINAEHLEGLVDLEGVFKEESTLLNFLKSESYLSLQSDDQFTQRLMQMAKCHTISSGFQELSDYVLSDWRLTSSGQLFTITEKASGNSTTVTLPLLGLHMARNAGLCIALASTLGIDLYEAARSLANFSSEKGRLQILKSNGMTIIDDTYNANPASMCAALDVLESIPGKRIAIIGDMGELGDKTEDMHRGIAQYLSTKDIDLVIGVGIFARSYSECGKAFHYFGTTDEAVKEIQNLTSDAEAILVKGSRFMKMEKIVISLKGDEC